MNTNRDFNKQRRLGIELALDNKSKINYEDPSLYPSLPQTAQASSLQGSEVTQSRQIKKRTNEFTKMETRIMDLYKQNQSVADSDQILDVEMWLQEGLRDVLQSGSVEVFTHWLMFIATPTESIRRSRQKLTSDKNGPPRMPQSEDARQGRAINERIWHKHWSKKDGGTIQTEHELHKFDRRAGLDKHAFHEKQEEELTSIPE